MSARILVIDDETGVTLFLRRLLERKGYFVTCCELPESGIEAAKASAYDLVICDKNLPNLHGLEVIRQIRELQPDIPAILMTAYPELLKSQVRIQGYLAKPFDNLQQVLDAVDRALAFGVLLRHSSTAGAGK